MRKIERISISSADRERLERLVRDRNTPQKVVWRARIVLLAGDGLTAEGIAAEVGKSLLTVRRWRRRYVARGVDGLLKDATRRSRVKPLTPEKIRQVVDMTLHQKPRESLKFVLERQGFAVRTFPSGAEALAGALVPDYSCLVTDYHMPGMDGLDLVGALRMRGNPIPALLLTGDPNRSVRDRAAAADVPVIAKWNLVDDLVGRIHEMVKGENQLRSLTV